MVNGEKNTVAEGIIGKAMTAACGQRHGQGVLWELWMEDAVMKSGSRDYDGEAQWCTGINGLEAEGLVGGF